MRPQTDPEFYGWTYWFTVEDESDWKEACAEMQKKWLESWNPPQEWMQ